MILIDGVYLYNFGGITILDRIIKELDLKELKYKVLLDHRHLPTKNTIILNKGIFSRYFFYKKNKNQFLKILCLGNVPPPVKCDAKVYLFFHNINLLINGDFITLLKRFIIKYNMSNLDEIIVQTKEVKKVLKKVLTDKFKINIYPVFDMSVSKLKFQKKSESKNITFLYPASFLSHKNHKLLFNLFRKPSINKRIKLFLTIENLEKNVISSLEKNNIYNLGLISNKEILEVLNNVSALIFPSTSESFGLPLVEAALLNKPILRIDLGYGNGIVQTPYLFKNNLNSLEKCINAFYNDLPNTISAKLLIKDSTHKIIQKLY